MLIQIWNWQVTIKISINADYPNVNPCPYVKLSILLYGTLKYTENHWYVSNTPSSISIFPNIVDLLYDSWHFSCFWSQEWEVTPFPSSDYGFQAILTICACSGFWLSQAPVHRYKKCPGFFSAVVIVEHMLKLIF